MIVHVIKAIDDEVVHYLMKNYNILSNQIPNELVEIRNLGFEEEKIVVELLKNELLNQSVIKKYDKQSSILILVSPKELLNHLTKNRLSSPTISEISNSLLNYIEGCNKKYEIGNKVFEFNKAYLMGILNVTPDSFSDGGNYFKLEDALNYGLKMIDYGADIIDIGGESTRPGSEFISEEEEKRRVLPVIEKLLKEKNDLILSIDTTKSKVAEIALDYGAKIVNDISSMTFDKNMIKTCSKKNAAVILMHMQGTPKTMQLNPTYDEVVSDIFNYLNSRIMDLRINDISKIIIDPGIGFGKSLNDNFTLIKRLKEFSTLGYPILIGLSRKSFIGKTLNLELNERDFPTSILETISLMNSARIIRTHNVKNGRMLVDLINKII